LYLSLIEDYIEFYKAQQETQETADSMFNFEGYLLSLKESNKSFITELVKTQLFAEFIEKSFVALKGNNEVSYFVSGVKKKQKGEDVLADSLNKIYLRLIRNYENVTHLVIL
jgi:hypothetical protein